MSHQHNQDRSFRQKESERGSETLIGRSVTARVEPLSEGSLSAPISNSEIMEQLYRMGDTLKKFGTRLDSIESGHRERSTQLSQGSHQRGKEVVIESEPGQADRQPKRFQVVT